MPVDGDIDKRIWAETRMLRPAGDNDAPLLRLQAALGWNAQRLSKSDLARFFPTSRSPPEAMSPAPDGEAAYKAMHDSIGIGAQGKWQGLALPGALALVKLTPAGKPDVPAGGYEPWLERFVDTGAPPVAVFSRGDDPSGRSYGLFERAAAVSGDERPWVSEVTGTGMRTAVVASRWQKYLAWLSWGLVAVAAVFSAWSAWSLYSKASRIEGAYAMFSGRDRAGLARYRVALEATCKDPAAVAGRLVCTEDFKKYWDKPSDCIGDVKPEDKEPQDKAQPAPASSTPPNASPFSAMKDLGTNEKRAVYSPSPACLAGWDEMLSFYDTPVTDNPPKLVSSRPQPLSLDFELTGMFSAILAFGAAIGLVGNGRFFGLWINAQNRFSLSTMQVSLWTALILAPFAAITLFQFVLLPEAAREGEGLQFAPSIPAMLYALMGITFSSTFLSKYILSVKDDSAAAPKAGDIERTNLLIANSDGLDVNENASEASLKDLFVGEEKTNCNQIDVSRFQNVVITLILVASYGFAIFAVMASVDTAALLGALHHPQSVFPNLPAVTGSFLALLLTSHAGYLIAKAAPK